MMDIKTTIATLSAIANVAKEANKIELYHQVLDLQQRIMEAMAENTELLAKNAELTRENIRLRDEAAAAARAGAADSELVFKDDVYWRMDGESVVDGPFCPRCKDADGKQVRMTDRKNGFTICVDCRHSIRTPGYVKPESQGRPSRGGGWVNRW